MLAGAAPRPAWAQLGNDYAKIIVHLVPASGGMSCSNSRGRPACQNMVVAGDLNTPYYAFVCVTDGDPGRGIAGVQFGVDYNGSNKRGVDIFDWNLCGTMQFPLARFPAAGTGNLVTWDASQRCQQDEPGGAGTGVTAVVGYFYLTAYSADTFKITRRPVDDAAKVSDCASNESLVDGFGVQFANSHLGFASFSEGATVAGYNPCGQVRSVEKKHWGEVKAGR